jgi:Tfp pilus assembly protein PilV
LRGTQGDTLIEVLAAVLLLGFIALGVFQWTATATRFVDQDQEEAQALRYARAGVQQIRVTALQDYSTNGSLPTTVTPPTLAPVHGVAYTETIGAATTPAWDNDPTVVGVHEYVVTVSWSVAGGTDHVSLTAVVDPPVVNL